MDQGKRSHQKAYVIVIEGVLEERWNDVFAGMEISRSDETTTLSGVVRDRSALHGILDRIMNFNLELVSVHRVH